MLYIKNYGQIDNTYIVHDPITKESKGIGYVTFLKGS